MFVIIPRTVLLILQTLRLKTKSCPPYLEVNLQKLYTGRSKIHYLLMKDSLPVGIIMSNETSSTQ